MLLDGSGEPPRFGIENVLPDPDDVASLSRAACQDGGEASRGREIVRVRGEDLVQRAAERAAAEGIAHGGRSEIERHGPAGRVRPGGRARGSWPGIVFLFCSCRPLAGQGVKRAAGKRHGPIAEARRRRTARAERDGESARPNDQRR
jgi:hypothetical protein